MAETTEQYRTRINQLKTDIENEPYIQKMREDIAEGISKTGNRQADIEEQFQDVIDNTTGKDVISAPELIAARNGEATLKDRLDKERQEVAAQLTQKASISYVDALLLDSAKGVINGVFNSVSSLKSAYPNGPSIKGTWAVFDSTFPDGAHLFMYDSTNSVWVDLGPYAQTNGGNNSVDTDNLTNGSVIRLKTELYEVGKNKFNKNDSRIKQNMIIHPVTSVHSPLDNYFISAPEDALPNTQYIISAGNWGGDAAVGRSYLDEYENVIKSEPNMYNVPFTTPARTRYIQFTGQTSRIDITQLEKGSVATAYAPYEISMVDSFSKEIVNQVVSEENPTNLIDRNNLSLGFLNITGSLTNSSDWRTTPFIDVSNVQGVVATYTVGGTFLAWFDGSDSFVTPLVNVSANTGSTFLKKPTGAVKARYSFMYNPETFNRFVLQKGLVSKNVGEYNKKIPANQMQARENKIVLPDNLVVAKNVEMNIYHDNLSYSHPGGLAFFIKTTKGNDYRHVLQVPANSTEGLSSLEIAAFDEHLDVVAEKSVALKIVNTGGLEGVSKNIMIIGDSFVGIGQFCVAIKKNLEQIGMIPNFIGTCHGVPGSPFNINEDVVIDGVTYNIPREGRSGGSMVEYVTNSPWNPFWNIESNTNDVAAYLANNNLDVPDVVVIQFTLNDLSAYQYKSDPNGIYATLITQLKTLSNDFKKVNPNVSVLFSIEPAGAINFSNRQNTFMRNAGHLGFAEALFDVFDGTGQYDFVKIVPSYAWVDRVNGYGGELDKVRFAHYPNIEEQHGGDSIHNNIGGMFQIGDAIYSSMIDVFKNEV